MTTANGLNFESLAFDEELRITIEIRDPIDLAGRRSEMAKFFGNIAPYLLKKEVRARVLKEAQLELQQKGVQAIVKVI